MISRNRAKFIKSLQLKKFRKLERTFVVEGSKSALELFNANYRIIMLVATPQFIQKNAETFASGGFEIIEASEKELSALGSFQNNSDVLVVAETKPNVALPININEYTLVLDDIRDPGNLGTILRIADWYGFRQIIASETSAELYNPKTLQASMGSFTHVNVYYTDLQEFLAGFNMPVYGAFLQGSAVHDVEFASGGVIIIGNESRGISSELLQFIHHRISIPRYGQAESLNAAIATAVICDNLRSRRVK